MDDDVQYLGTRFAVPSDPCEPHTVTGITLHVDKCGDKPPHTLTFYRANSEYVHIGRKSGSDFKPMRRESDDHNAVFACQVVSAKHAKLVFSDGGQIYIVDRRSRHGTHLLRRGEAQRMLQPEVETQLADGDVLTFGKVVGAGSYHVSPVSVRVELLTGHPSSEPPAVHTLSPSIRALSPFDPPSPAHSRPRKLSSGRYGLLSASCIESDSSQSSSSVSVPSDIALSDQESDMEDEHVCIPPVFRDNQAKMAIKIPALRSFIRDVYHHPPLHSPVIVDDVDEPLEDVPVLPLPSIAPRPPSPVVVVIDSFPSRSHSPIEVASPSLSEASPSEAPPSEPAVIGAWPDSRPESPRHSSLEVETSRSEVPPLVEPDHGPELTPAQPSPSQGRGPPLSNDALIELMHRLPPPPPFFPMGGPFSTSIASDFGLPSVPPPPPPHFPPHRVPPFQPVHKVVTEYVNSEIKGPLKNVEDRIVALQETIDSLKSRQTVTEEEVVDILGRVEILEPDSERLFCRVAGVERNNASISTLQGQMIALQNQVATLRERLDTPEPRPVETPGEDTRACANALNNLVSGMENIKTCASALNNLVSEMISLREDVEKRIEAEMEEIQSVRAEALDAMKDVAVAAESVKSSKRKREVEELEEEAPEVAVPLVVAVETIACSPPAVLDEISESEVTVPRVPVPQVPAFVPKEDTPKQAFESTRPRKRARTAAYTVARTAAAMVIGAAATWSALAFS